MSNVDSNDPAGTAEDSANMSEADMAALIGSNVLDKREDPETDDQTAEQEADGTDEQSEDDPLAFLEDEDETDDELSESDDPEDDSESNGPLEIADDTTFVFDGQEMTGAQLRDGIMLKADHTRKTQELAEERKAHEALSQRVRDAESRATQELKFAEELLTSLVPQMPAASLADPNHQDYDPVAYQSQRAQHEEWSRYVDQVKGQMAEKAKEQEAEQTAKFDEFRNSEASKLFEAVPALKDDKNLNTFFKEAGAMLSSKYQIPEAELRNIPQHQFWLMAKDLLRLQKIDSKRMKAVRKGKGKPRVMKSGHREGAGVNTVAADKNMSKRIQRAQTGKADDAALAQLIGQSVLNRE